MKKQKIRLIPFNEIEFRESIYPRQKRESDTPTVLHYRSAKKAGSIFPPITVNILDGTTYLVDGLHRMDAFRPFEEHIRAHVYEGLSEKEMLQLAIKLNAEHGRKLEHKDIVHCHNLLKKMGLSIEDVNKVIRVTPTYIKPHVVVNPKVKNHVNGSHVYNFASQDLLIPCPACNGTGKIRTEKKNEKTITS